MVEFLIAAFGARLVHQYLHENGTIAHADLIIGDSHLMLTECAAPNQPMPGAVFFYVPDTDAVYRAALAAGATSMREPADEFYGDRCAGVRDAVGNIWWIATHIEDVSDEEMRRRHAEAKQKAVA
jgi:PhnB protein